jgi:ferredoxin
VVPRILVDLKKCAGIGACEAEDPDVFEVQPEGVVRILCDRPAPDHLTALEAAVAMCPTGALSLVED